MYFSSKDKIPKLKSFFLVNINGCNVQGSSNANTLSQFNWCSKLKFRIPF